MRTIEQGRAIIVMNQASAAFYHAVGNEKMSALASKHAREKLLALIDCEKFIAAVGTFPTSFYEMVNWRSLAVLDLTQWDDRYDITRINVPRSYRGKGIASRLLKRCTDAADLFGITLELGVSPSDGLNYKQLVAWYERNGFGFVSDDDHMMRIPR